ncbi:MAG: hypothetical protein ACI8PZ_001405 [Myxococcota bacterium]
MHLRTEGCTCAPAHGSLCTDAAECAPSFTLPLGPEADTEVRAFDLGDGLLALRTLVYVRLFDAAGALVDDLDPEWIDANTRFRHTWIDTHDVIELREGPWAGAVAVLTGSADTTPAGDRLGYGIAVVDLAARAVLWDWSSHGAVGDDQPIDPRLPYDRTHPLEAPEDWQHANALLHGLEPDGRQFFWLSLRHQDWLIKVDVQTDAVVWRLGDGGDFALVASLDDPVPLTPDRWMFHQHAPQLVARDGDRVELVLFDNGNLRRAPDGTWDLGAELWSRVAGFALDEGALLAAPTLSIGEPGEFISLIRGDADLLPGGDRVQYLVSWPGRPAIVTVDAHTGEEL